MKLKSLLLLAPLSVLLLVNSHTLQPQQARQQLLHWFNSYTNVLDVTARQIRNYNRQYALPSTMQTPIAPASGPLRLNPANPRYFSDATGRTVYLTGSHTWLNLQDGVLSDPPPAFDYDLYLDFLIGQNHNFFRLWLWEEAKWISEWRQPYYFDPLPFQRTGPGETLDGKPKFDLTTFDPRYFERLRQRVQQAGDRGIYVSIMLFNGWSVAYPKGHHALNNPWRGHPFHPANNVNGINGDPNGDESGSETHELFDPAVMALQKAYIKQVIDTVNDLDNVLYEISNESHANSQDWQIHLIEWIKDYEANKPKQHPVGMTVEWPDGNNAELFDSPADWISPNDGARYFENPPAADGSKVIIADTDHLCGICGDRKWVWKSFLRGLNPIFMDEYDNSYKLNGGFYRMTDPTLVSLRRNLGYTRYFANRMELAAMKPQGRLSSTGYCLANLGKEYLIYLPDGGEAVVDLTAARGELSVEWFNPETGEIVAGEKVIGGAKQPFHAPFAGDAVLYLHEVKIHSV